MINSQGIHDKDILQICTVCSYGRKSTYWFSINSILGKLDCQACHTQNRINYPTRVRQSDSFWYNRFQPFDNLTGLTLFRRPLCPRYINVSKNYHVGQSQVLPHDHIWEIQRLVPATKSHKTVLTEPVTSWYLLKSGNQVIFFLAKIHLLSWKCESLLHQVSSSRLPAYFPFFNWPRRYVYLHQRLLVSTFLNE